MPVFSVGPQTVVTPVRALVPVLRALFNGLPKADAEIVLKGMVKAAGSNRVIVGGFWTRGFRLDISGGTSESCRGLVECFVAGFGGNDFSLLGALKAGAKRAYHVIRFALNAPLTGAAAGYASVKGGDCHFQTGLMVVCSNTSPGANGGAPAVTLGNTVIADDGLSEAELRHETKHADQWAIVNGPFGPLGGAAAGGAIYGLTVLFQGSRCNWIEKWAGYADGNYFQCL